MRMRILPPPLSNYLTRVRSSVCPYDFVKVPEGSVPDRDNYIETHEKEWQHNTVWELDARLCRWVMHSPSHLAQLVKVLTTYASLLRLLPQTSSLFVSLLTCVFRWQ